MSGFRNRNYRFQAQREFEQSRRGLSMRYLDWSEILRERTETSECDDGLPSFIIQNIRNDIKQHHSYMHLPFYLYCWWGCCVCGGLLLLLLLFHQFGVSRFDHDSYTKFTRALLMQTTRQCQPTHHNISQNGRTRDAQREAKTNLEVIHLSSN